MKSTAQVHFGEHRGLPHMVDAFINARHRVNHVLGQVIETPVIHTHALGAIVFLGEEDSCTQLYILECIVYKFHAMHLFLLQNAIQYDVIKFNMPPTELSI